MATKSTKGNATVAPTKTAKKKQAEIVIELTPEQLTGALRRFGSALEKLESFSPAEIVRTAFIEQQKEQAKNQALVKSQTMQTGAELSSAAPPPPHPSLGGMINNSMEISADLLAISDDICDRLRGGGGVGKGQEGTRPSSGPMKDSVDTVNDRMIAVINNLRTINEYVFG